MPGLGVKRLDWMTGRLASLSKDKSERKGRAAPAEPSISSLRNLYFVGSPTLLTGVGGASSPRRRG